MAYDYTDLASGRLVSQLATGTTSGITLQADTVNGNYTYAPWPTGAHKITIKRKLENTTQYEKLLVASATQNSTTGVVTLGTLTRNISAYDGTDTTGTSSTITWPSGTLVYVGWDNRDAEQTAKKDEANTFTATQMISGTNELNFNSSATSVWKDGSGNLSLKDAANGTKTLTQLAAAGGADEKTKVSSNDTTQGYLNGKLVAGAGITLTENSDGSNETLSVIASNTVSTGHTGLSTIPTGAIPIGAGTSNMTTLSSSTIGLVPRTTGSTTALARVPFCAYTNTADSNDISSGGSYTMVDWDTSYTIPAGDLVAGTVYEMYATGVTSTSADLGGKWGIKVGSNVMLFNNASAIAITSAGGLHVWTLRARLICRTTGASGTIQLNGELDCRTSTGTTIWKNEIIVPNSTSTVDTTGTLVFAPQFGWQTDTNTRVSKIKNIVINRI